MPAVHLETARLRLRPFAPDDVPALHAIFTDPEVRRYLLDDRVMPRSWAEEVVADSARCFEQAGWGIWSVARAAEPEPIGFAGYRTFHDPPVAELL